MTRVLTLTSWYPPHHFGGYEVCCHAVVSRLMERGHDVEVLCCEERIPGAEAVDVAHEAHVQRMLRMYARAGSKLQTPTVRERWAIERANQAELVRALDEFRPEVVAVWHMGAMSLGLLTALVERRVPMVFALLDDWLCYGRSLDAWTRLFERSVWRRWVGRAMRPLLGVPTVVADLGDAGAFCFTSDSTRRRAEAASPWRFPISTVAFLGIDRREFPRMAQPPDRPWRGRLLYVGRLDSRKGIATLLRAVALLGPDVSLGLHGRGDRKPFETLAADLGIADRVAFGELDRSELPGRYAAADVVVFPSEWEEPFGLVPVEAMACGTPVVATGTGGSGEYLRGGRNCLLFPPGDPSALAAAVQRLHRDCELRRSVIEGGLHTADELDLERLVDVLEGWYTAAAEGLLRPPATRRTDVTASSRPDSRRAASALTDSWTGRVLDAGWGGRQEVAVKLSGATTHTVAAALDDLPFRDQAFDGVIAEVATDGVRSNPVAVAEVRRVLRRDGAAILATPNRASLDVVRAKLSDLALGHRFGSSHYAGGGHPRYHTWAEFERLVRREFVIRRRVPVGWSGGRKARLATRLVRLGALRRFSQGIVVEAEPT